MIKRDFYFSIFLLSLAAAVVIESLRMPRELAGHSPYAAPGLVPGIIGIAIFICALILLLKTVKNSPNPKAETKNNPDQWQELARVKPEDPKPVEEAEPAQWKPLLITVLLVAIYAVGLVGTVPFWLATFLFVSAF